MTERIDQGDVWEIDFGEEAGVRPAVIVSRNQLNEGDLLLVVPCTSERVQERIAYPNNVFLCQGKGGLPRDSAAQTHLIQPIRRHYFLRRLGELNYEELGTVLVALAWVVDLFEQHVS